MKATKILKATLHELGIDNNDDWKAAGIEKVTHIDQDMTVNFLMTDGSTKKAKYPETTLTTIDDVDIIIEIGSYTDMTSGSSQDVNLSLTGCVIGDLTVSSSNGNIATVSFVDVNINIDTMSSTETGEVTITVTHDQGESESFTITVS